MRDPATLIEGASNWMANYAERCHLRAWVVGVSGGIDSTVVERLSEKTGLPVVAIAMPMYLHENSDPTSLDRAMQLCCGRKGVDFRIRQIGPIWEAYRAQGIAITGSNPDHIQLSQGNLRSRIRADILRDAAGEVGGCVVGTGNMDEDEIGYFTKGGDGDVDICPISKMHKAEVYAMARAFEGTLEVPQDCLDAVPTAGLWDGQTDEDELGMTYDEIAWALTYTETGAVLTDRQQEVFRKVSHMRKINAHKLSFPPVYEP